MIQGTLSGVNPLQQVSHLAILPSRMVDVSRPPIGKGNVMEDWRVSPWGVRHSCGLTRLLHCPTSLKRLISRGLNDVPSGRLLGESFFSHIQTSMSEMLSVLFDSPRIGSGTPSGLCFQPRSTVMMSPAVPGPTPNQSGLGLSTRHCAWMCRKVTFISHARAARGVYFESSWSSLKCMSSRGHTLYHLAFLGTERPSG
jgi:hypothetical protein